MSIEILFAQPAALPVVPKVVAELIRSFEKEDVPVDEVAFQLAADPVLSAKTLRLANSACFYASRRIESVNEALRMLGFLMVRNLVLGAGLADAFRSVPGMDLPHFWRHSVHTACAARWLAARSGEGAELAFTVGLLHGIGHLVMHAVLGKDLVALDRRVPLHADERAREERAMLGYHHGDVGAVLAQRWRLPATIAEALRAVPQPGVEGVPVESLVHLAAWRARVDNLHLSSEEAAATVPHAVAAQVGLALRWLAPEGTLAVRVLTGGEESVMPPHAELCAGLESLH
jgi:HD-like signal output (HDOD) protein